MPNISLVLTLQLDCSMNMLIQQGSKCVYLTQPLNVITARMAIKENSCLKKKITEFSRKGIYSFASKKHLNIADY